MRALNLRPGHWIALDEGVFEVLGVNVCNGSTALRLQDVDDRSKSSLKYVPSCFDEFDDVTTESPDFVAWLREAGEHLDRCGLRSDDLRGSDSVNAWLDGELPESWAKDVAGADWVSVLPVDDEDNWRHRKIDLEDTE